MRKLACLAGFSVALMVGACASMNDDGGATSDEALTTLTVAQCKTPVVHTSPKTDPAGGAIAGSAHTTLTGCIVGSQGETGDAVLTRLTTLLADTPRLGTVKNAQGGPVFQQFTPGARHGTLATSLTQDVDVTLAMDHSPFTKLHTVQRRPAGAPYALSIVNATALSASVAFFTVTVVNPGELSLTLEVKTAANGITVTGASDIVLQQQQDQAASASVLVSDLYRWLTTELSKTAPRPAPDAGTAQDGASQADGGSSPGVDGAARDGASARDGARD